MKVVKDGFRFNPDAKLPQKERTDLSYALDFAFKKFDFQARILQRDEFKKLARAIGMDLSRVRNSILPLSFVVIFSHS